MRIKSERGLGMTWLMDALNQLGDTMSAGGEALSYVTAAIRMILPLLAIVVVWRSVKSLLRGTTDHENWGYLCLPNGSKIELSHWENIIGRARASDVHLEYPTLSRSHAAVIRDERGVWRVFDLRSKGGVLRNGKSVDKSAVIKNGDLLTLGGVQVVFTTISRDEQVDETSARTRPNRFVRPSGTLWYLSVFQLLLTVQLLIATDDAYASPIVFGFAALIALMWVAFVLTRALQRVAFEVESLAFFLTTLGFAIVASDAPDTLVRQTVLLVVAVALYFILGWFLRDLSRAVKIRWPVAVIGLALLGVTLITSEAIHGAKNWLTVIGVTFQPSEFVKIAFVFAGAATLDRLFARRNLYLFIAFSALCVGVLALMGDFGTALVFFVTYLVIAFMRSGDFTTIFLSVGGSVLAGFMAVTLKPEVADRFKSWGNAWAYASSSGFQQTRAMSAAASGGLFGVGAGNGWLVTIVAAQTDMVFAVLSEELGLLVALTAVVTLVALGVYVVRASASARSAYFAIGAGAAAAIMLIQMLLNVFGSLDILPFTGVTFPFVSTGGSSLIVCWGLLAFIKAIDTRRGASFAVKAPVSVTNKAHRAARPAQSSGQRTSDYSGEQPAYEAYDEDGDYGDPYDDDDVYDDAAQTWEDDQ